MSQSAAVIVYFTIWYQSGTRLGQYMTPVWYHPHEMPFDYIGIYLSKLRSGYTKCAKWLYRKWFKCYSFYRRVARNKNSWLVVADCAPTVCFASGNGALLSLCITSFSLLLLCSSIDAEVSEGSNLLCMVVCFLFALCMAPIWESIVKHFCCDCISCLWKPP